MIIKCIVRLLFLQLALVNLQAECHHSLKPDRIVAHAGGSYNSYTYTNSHESLERSYKDGLRYFEIDLHWTSDKRLVCLHDWESTFRKIYNRDTETRLTYKEFITEKTAINVRPCTFETLAKWMTEHPDAFLITDIKEDNGEALKRIANSYPELKERIIPQIYFPREWKETKRLGFQHIIFTLYRNTLKDTEVLHFAKNKNLFGVTMTPKRGSKGIAKKLCEHGIFTYAHTINSIEHTKELTTEGFNSIYTDNLTPHDFLKRAPQKNK